MSDVEQSKPLFFSPQRWHQKFSCALRGVVIGVWGQSSFAVHLPAAVLVIVAAWWLEVTPAQWLTLQLCILLVLVAELLNSALEHLARAVTRQNHPEIRDALDIASGAVLTAAVGASLVATGILLSHVACG